MHYLLEVVPKQQTCMKRAYSLLRADTIQVSRAGIARRRISSRGVVLVSQAFSSSYQSATSLVG